MQTRPGPGRASSTLPLPFLCFRYLRLVFVESEVTRVAATQKLLPVAYSIPAGLLRLFSQLNEDSSSFGDRWLQSLKVNAAHLTFLLFSASHPYSGSLNAYVVVVVVVVVAFFLSLAMSSAAV